MPRWLRQSAARHQHRPLRRHRSRHRLQARLVVVVSVSAAGGVPWLSPVLAHRVNAVGKNILMVMNSNLGSCMDLCKANQRCMDFFLRRGLPGLKECGGGTPKGRCDLKTFQGEPSYFPDMTATSGDGYMSQYVTSRDMPKDPR